MLTSAQAIIEDESARATRRDTDPKAAWRFRTLDGGARKISDGVPRSGDLHPPNRLLAQLFHGKRRVRVVSALSVHLNAA